MVELKAMGIDDITGTMLAKAAQYKIEAHSLLS